MKKLFFFLVLCFLYSGLYSLSANAQTMSNSQFMIEMGNFNSISGKPSNGAFSLQYTSGQTGNGLYVGTNYKVRAGFQYISSIIPFRFKITNPIVNFGVVSPTSPVLRTTTLTISNGSAFGYQVLTSQNHNLRANASGVEIPPTVCGDSGPICTTTTAGPWTSNLNYGFGYRCDDVSGTNCSSQFATANYYEQFAASPSAVAVMSGSAVGTSLSSTVTYKLNISGSQPAGLYTNVINYIAVPMF
jgi:hypothetical protein